MNIGIFRYLSKRLGLRRNPVRIMRKATMKEKKRSRFLMKKMRRRRMIKNLGLIFTSITGPSLMARQKAWLNGLIR